MQRQHELEQPSDKDALQNRFQYDRNHYPRTGQAVEPPVPGAVMFAAELSITSLVIS